jgi:carbon-monoxide dehydrogenase iron sulfur subunit
MKRIWIDRKRCLGCKTCELQCAVERNSLSRTLFEAIREDPLPLARVAVCGGQSPFPLQCRHCEQAACLSACPSGALQRNDEQGLVFIDQTRCRGCWMCVMSCPFGCIIPSAAFHVAVKCDACMHMDAPACVAGCPTGALLYGDEAGYGKVLAKRRGTVALWVAEETASAGAGALSLESIVGEENRE